MTTPDGETGRFRQRRRTRAAIVAATTELLRAGVTPSVGQVAEAADVSRRTVYQYFPTLEQLLLDATLGMLSQAAVDEAIDAADTHAGTDGDASARVAAMIGALTTTSAEMLPYGRQLIRLTVDAPPAGDAASPRRGYRRVAWLERALEPLRPRLEPAAFERLVSALAMVVGWEALIVLGDVRGLDTDEQLDVSLWSARALVRAALEEAGTATAATPDGGSSKR
jgi:AcrR family transcriptional regulator